MAPRWSLPEDTDGRTAAVLAVLDALSGRRFVGESLRAMRAAGQLGDREAGLANEIAMGTVRHVILIEQVLSTLASFRRPRVRPVLRAILYTAAHQIIWLDRIPEYAAVDRAVELARELAGGRAPGMVNAVLRRVTRAVAARCSPWSRLNPAQVRTGWDAACTFSTPVLPPPSPDDGNLLHLAAATAERPARYADLCARHGAAAAEAVAWASQAVPVTVLQRNPLRAAAPEFAVSLKAIGEEGVDIVDDTAFAPAGAAVLQSPLFTDGGAYVQDGTAHAAAVAVEAQPGERILDLCAAPGGKSVALAIGMRDRGEVVACDADPERLAMVRQNVQRLGLTCVQTCALDEIAPPFDAALVDVPCSNTGVLARRPEARLGLTSKKLAALANTQRELLRRAADLVRPGGRLVYSTCSLEQEENERAVAEFLSGRTRWRLDAESLTLPSWGPRPSDWRDGGYYARLRQG